MSTWLNYGIHLLVTIVVSVTVSTVCSVAALSSGILSLGPLGAAINPVSETARWGLIVGLAHGLFTAVLIVWFKDSLLGTVKSSVFATEILVAIAILTFLIREYLSRPVQPDGTRIALTIENLGQAIVFIAFWYAILSVILLIPSIVIGFTNKHLFTFVKH